MAVQFKRETLNAVMSAVMDGSPLPEGWPATRMLTKIRGIHDLIDEDTDLGELQNDLDTLIEAVDNEEDIEIVEGDDSPKSKKASKKTSKKTSKKSTKKPTASKKSTKKPTASKKSTKKPTASKKVSKKKPTAKTSKASKKVSKKKPTAKKGPGVIATIIDCLKKAKKSSPVSKDDILEVLVETFPERTADAMLKTINTQVPGRLKSEKGLNIIKVDGGYYIGRR